MRMVSLRRICKECYLGKNRNKICVVKYSHLSNKREVTLTDLEKFHSPQKKNPPLHKIVFSWITQKLFKLELSFKSNMFQPIFQLFKYKMSGLQYSNLHVSWFCNFCTPSTFIPTSTFIREMRVLKYGGNLRK